MVTTRITADTVRLIAEDVERFTGGAFSLGYTRSDVDGTVFVDGVRQKVWRGRFGGRRAIAYYLGAADGWNVGGTIGDLPPSLGSDYGVRRQVLQTAGTAQDYADGLSDGEYRRRTRR